MMLGMGSHFEIWDAAKLAEDEHQPSLAACPMSFPISPSKAPA
jgi:DNA-binding transcriptional regulator/RsmH inhibitor MraZ